MLKALIQIGFQISYVVSVPIFVFRDRYIIHLLDSILEFHSLDMLEIKFCSFTFVFIPFSSAGVIVTYPRI